MYIITIIPIIKNNIMWQKCPICNGTGKRFSEVRTDTHTVCRTCSGSGIIDQLTGFPPNTPNQPYTTDQQTASKQLSDENKNQEEH